MKEWKILILILLCTGPTYSQSNRWRAELKLLKDNYPNKSDSVYGIMLDGLYRLRECVSDAILEFRVKCNPEINPKTVYDTIRQRFQAPQKVFNLPSQKVVIELQPFEFMSNDKKVKLTNFFVVNKKGTKIIPDFFSVDTLSLTQYDKYYPFDEKLLVYCNPEEGSGADVKILSGACDVSFFDIRPYKRELLNITEPRYAAFFRLYRFGLKKIEQIRHYYPSNNYYPTDSIKDSIPYSWFQIDSFSLAKGHAAVVKVPYPDKFSDKYNYFDGIEVIFYEWPLPSENKGQGFWEVKYIFHNHPKSYEDTLPKYRKLGHEEIIKMGREYFEVFMEPVIRYETPPDEKE